MITLIPTFKPSLQLSMNRTPLATQPYIKNFYKGVEQQMEQLEQAIIYDLAITKFSEMIYEFQSNCKGINDKIEQILENQDFKSRKLFQTLRLLFEF